MIRNYIRLLVVIVLTAINCTPTKLPKVEITGITFPNEQGKLISGILYRPAIEGKSPCLIFAYMDEPGKPQTENFLLKLSKQGYIVFELNLNDADSLIENTPASNLVAAVCYLRSLTFVKPDKIAIMGSDKAGTAAIQAAVTDTTISAVITLAAYTVLHNMDITELVGEIAPRPIVIIASDQDVNVSKQDSQRLYDLAKEPKKLIWLASDVHGTETLGTHLEPIIRQVTLLFLKKYLKK